MLVIALVGHFATLLRATVRTMLAERDVYIDWHNARDVAPGPLFRRIYRHLIRFRDDRAAPMVAVCQPA